MNGSGEKLETQQLPTEPKLTDDEFSAIKAMFFAEEVQSRAEVFRQFFRDRFPAVERFQHGNYAGSFNFYMNRAMSQHPDPITDQDLKTMMEAVLRHAETDEHKTFMKYLATRAAGLRSSVTAIRGYLKEGRFFE